MCLEIIDLNKTIRGNKILENINLKIDNGSITAFYGKNGSGKTMLLRAISGLVKLSSGKIILNREEVTDNIIEKTNLGVLIENPDFWNNYTGFENLKALSKIRNIIKDEDIISTLEMVGLDPHDKRKVGTYSLGMKQKLGIAQAVMENPKILILDEPTNALDDESVENFRNILINQKSKGTIILISSHNKEDIDSICDNRYKISNGNIEEIIYEKI